ncbi:MAG: hypothetical protein QNJ14_15040 [Woeseiaceae bacterium]|nr:hypothetical protein [Woeseiaceae bacterium]
MSTSQRGQLGRYEISVLDGRYGLFAIRIFDRERRHDVVAWHGDTARYLLAAGALPDHYTARFLADKSVVWHLVLAAAAYAANEKLDTPPMLAERLDRLDLELTGAEARLARMLFEHPGQHLSLDDIVCLCSLRYPATGHLVPGLLEQLARKGVIQKITVDRHTVFFDLDTRPHVHVFDRRTRELLDAPTQGVIQMG